MRQPRSVWTVTPKPFKGAHFATFPPDLIRPCILAGCPEFACVDCGAPHEQIVEREHRGATKGPRPDAGMSCPSGKAEGSNTRGMPHNPVTLLGWKPTCECNAPHIGGTVLDPFFGAGTTGLVAAELGRDCIGFELNPEYAAIARERLGLDTPRPRLVIDLAAIRAELAARELLRALQARIA
jgi:hypothetical protein